MLYILTVGLMVFGMVVAVFKVQADTSFGLQAILHTIELLTIGVLGILAGRHSVARDVEPPKP